MTSSPHEQSTIRPPHPLAVDIAVRLSTRPGARILDYCAGSGRNTAYLRNAGFDVLSIADEEARHFDRAPGSRRFAGLVSSHGLLHGSAAELPQRVSALAGCLEAGGWIGCTFGSKRDARYGVGTRASADTFAPIDGDETGVPHAYFDEGPLREMLEPLFEIELLEERDATQTAGTWAHATPLSDAVHWFFIGRALSYGFEQHQPTPINQQNQ